MIKHFTKNLAQSVFLFAIIMGISSSINAQSILRVNSPADIAGDYEVVRSVFGDQSGAEITADLAAGNDGVEGDVDGDGNFGTETDGCEALMNGGDLNGNIALIDRGECPFVLKADNISATGAVAMLVCQNSADEPFAMSGDTQFQGTGMMMSQADCEIIKMAMASGTVNATFIYTCEVDYPADAFWGGSQGEGDFNAGLGDWTTGEFTIENSPRTELEFGWTPNGASNCNFFGGNTLMTSNSVCNGAAMIDFCDMTLSDFPNPAQPYPFYSVELISPIIDCSGRNNVTLTFSTLNNRLNGDPMISFSNDGGMNWSTPEIIETNNVVNETLETETITLPVNMFNDFAECQIKFIAEGDFYFFMVDDVYLTESEVKDAAIGRDWYSGAPFAQYPSNQLGQPIYFMADVYALGNSSPGDTRLEVSVTDANGTEVHSDVLQYGVLDPTLDDSTYQNRVFETPWAPDADGEYTITYDLIAEDDNNLSNNTFSSTFTVGGTTFSKVPYDIPLIRNSYTTAGNYFSIGNAYTFSSETWANGQAIVLDSLTFGYGLEDNNLDHAATALGNVYIWYDLSGDNAVQPDERILVASGEMNLFAGMPSERIAMPLYKDFDTEEKFVITADLANDPDVSGLIVMIDHQTILPGTNPDGTDAFWSYSCVNTSNYPEYNTVANSFALENSPNPILLPFALSGLGGTESDREERVYNEIALTGGGTLQWYTPLHFDPIGLVNSEDLFNEDIKINVFPNPAVDYTNVELSLEANAEYVNIMLADVTGKIVVAERHLNVTNKTINLDLSNVSSGLYTLQVVTPEGFNSTKLTIQK